MTAPGPGPVRLLIEPLAGSHDRSAFSCGNEALDRYLREQSAQDMKRKSAVVYVLTDAARTRVYGYYTLAASSAPLGEFPPEVAKRLPKYPAVPVTLIGRMAVDRSHQRQGHGESLLMDALRVSHDGSRRVASAAVVVDAKDERSASFCREFGFIPLGARPLRLFIAIKTVAAALLRR